ncbi:MAG: methyltransferase domain-containing protein [Deltaproteobacteria bacterium]|nr:MAG: methyltransferase domain-containing protein [Deltaproteobacteria bacterium]
MQRRALELLACPSCRGAFRTGLRCEGCGREYAAPEGIPELRLDADPRTEAVRAFYADAPFPGYPPRDSHAALRARAGRSELARLLDGSIAGDARIVELGCGTGQMSLFLASADRVVVGADLSRPSLRLAEAARLRFGIDRALFVETDLRAPGLREGTFDVVLANGVLHHTPDPPSSFAAMARLARPGGTVIVGLYNAVARIPHRLRRGGEVRGWFRDNGVEWLRAVPDTLLGTDPPGSADLFQPAGDDWVVEDALAQISWAGKLAHEGGLFVAVGRMGKD